MRNSLHSLTHLLLLVVFAGCGDVPADSWANEGERDDAPLPTLFELRALQLRQEVGAPGIDLGFTADTALDVSLLQFTAHYSDGRFRVPAEPGYFRAPSELHAEDGFVGFSFVCEGRGAVVIHVGYEPVSSSDRVIVADCGGESWVTGDSQCGNAPFCLAPPASCRVESVDPVRRPSPIGEPAMFLISTTGCPSSTPLLVRAEQRGPDTSMEEHIIRPIDSEGQLHLEIDTRPNMEQVTVSARLPSLDSGETVTTTVNVLDSN